MTYRVSISYRDSANKPYNDPTYVLDLQSFMGSAVPPRGIPELASRMKDIRDELKKWGRKSSAIHVRTIDHYADVERQREELEMWRAEQEAERAQQEATPTPSPSPQPEEPAGGEEQAQ